MAYSEYKIIHVVEGGLRDAAARCLGAADKEARGHLERRGGRRLAGRLHGDRAETLHAVLGARSGPRDTGQGIDGTNSRPVDRALPTLGRRTAASGRLQFRAVLLALRGRGAAPARDLAGNPTLPRPASALQSARPRRQDRRSRAVRPAPLSRTGSLPGPGRGLKRGAPIPAWAIRQPSKSDIDA